MLDEGDHHLGWHRRIDVAEKARSLRRTRERDAQPHVAVAPRPHVLERVNLQRVPRVVLGARDEIAQLEDDAPEVVVRIWIVIVLDRHVGIRVREAHREGEGARALVVPLWRRRVIDDVCARGGPLEDDHGVRVGGVGSKITNAQSRCLKDFDPQLSNGRNARFEESGRIGRRRHQQRWGARHLVPFHLQRPSGLRREPACARRAGIDLLRWQALLRHPGAHALLDDDRLLLRVAERPHRMQHRTAHSLSGRASRVCRCRDGRGPCMAQCTGCMPHRTGCRSHCSSKLVWSIMHRILDVRRRWPLLAQGGHRLGRVTQGSERTVEDTGLLRRGGRAVARLWC